MRSLMATLKMKPVQVIVFVLGFIAIMVSTIRKCLINAKGTQSAAGMFGLFTLCSLCFHLASQFFSLDQAFQGKKLLYCPSWLMQLVADLKINK